MKQGRKFTLSGIISLLYLPKSPSADGTIERYFYRDSDHEQFTELL